MPVALMLAAGIMTGPHPASAPQRRPEHVAAAEHTGHRLCAGYRACRAAGRPDFGYSAARSVSWWQMTPGANCTNFVAYRLIRAGLPDRRPAPDAGQDAGRLGAARWGLVYASRTDHHPTPGAVAWWRHGRDGRAGHVAYVEAINPDGTITVSEDSAHGNGFDWTTITPSYDWPSGFIHLTAPKPPPAHRRPSPAHPETTRQTPAAPAPGRPHRDPIRYHATPTAGRETTVPPAAEQTRTGTSPRRRPRPLGSRGQRRAADPVSTRNLSVGMDQWTARAGLDP